MTAAPDTDAAAPARQRELGAALVRWSALLLALAALLLGLSLWQRVGNTQAQLARRNPRLWLDLRQFYGDLAETRAFAEPFEHWLTMMYRDGMNATLQNFLGAN